MASHKNNRPQIGDPKVTELPELLIAVDKVCFIARKARQYAVKVAVSDPDTGSNATDDGMVDVLEDDRDDPVRHELVSLIHDLNYDEKADLVALAWAGRGDGGIDDWSALRMEARNAQNNRTAAYLLGLPLLASYLEEGLSMFGQSCGEFED